MSTSDLDRVANDLARFHFDPEGWCWWAYPWGEGSLEGEEPREWQLEMFRYIGEQLRANAEIEQGDDDDALIIRYAVASGHGIGKSAASSILADWAMSTMPMCRVMCFANTEDQLKTKLGGELAKWRSISRTASLFTSKKLSMYQPDFEKNWRLDLQPWSELRPEAVAGLHNKRRRILIIMDEASAIPRAIWESLEGAMTDTNTQIIWVVFGNPTRNSGAFAECFKARQTRWHGIHINSEDVPGTNKKLFKEWEEDYGRDSDFYKVRVLGQFPSAGDMQFIDDDLVNTCRKQRAVSTPEDPIVVGIDVARGGADRSVLYARRGRDGKFIEPVILPDTRDSMHFASRVADYLERLDPDAIFVDGGGVGGPFCDRLKQLGWPVVEVQFGGKADNDDRFANKRSEMWSRLRDWMRAGGSIWDHYQVNKEFGVSEVDTDKKDRILLESKDSLRKRGEASPDIADALALTFAYPTTRTGRRIDLKRRPGRRRRKAKTDYDLYADY